MSKMPTQKGFSHSSEDCNDSLTDKIRAIINLPEDIFYVLKVFILLNT